MGFFGQEMPSPGTKPGSGRGAGHFTRFSPASILRRRLGYLKHIVGSESIVRQFPQGMENPNKRSRWDRRCLPMLVQRGCWIYLALLLAVWALLRLGDRWWPATLLLFGPRWPFALPLLVLTP